MTATAAAEHRVTPCFRMKVSIASPPIGNRRHPPFLLRGQPIVERLLRREGAGHRVVAGVAYLRRVLAHRPPDDAAIAQSRTSPARCQSQASSSLPCM